MAKGQTNLFSVDVDAIVASFALSRGWTADGVEAEKQQLAQQLESEKKRLEEVSKSIELLTETINTIGNREEAAKEHAKMLAQALGKLASEGIIKAALEEKFPGRKVTTAAGTSGGKGKPTKEEKARRLEEIKTVLDYEGLSMTDVAKALEAKGVTYAQPTLKGYLEDLASDQNSGVISAIPAGKSRPLFMLAKTETK